MPKETFFHLPEDKRKRILDAAADEVVRVPVSEMSINKIVQAAGISRGSFYQYFEDKQDLIQFLLSDYINMMKNGIKAIVIRTGGNLFTAMEEILHSVILLSKDGMKSQGMKHIMTDEQPKSCALSFMMGLQNDIVEILMEEADPSRLRQRSDADVELLARTLFVLLKEAAAGCLYDITKAEQIEKGFKRQLELLRKGAELEEKNVEI